MIIRREQVEAFERHATAQFERRALEHLRAELTDLTEELRDDQLLARIRACVPRAASYGLENQEEVLAFIDASYLLADVSFDSNPSFPWAQRILSKKYLDPPDKARRLLERAFREHQSMGLA